VCLVGSTGSTESAGPPVRGTSARQGVLLSTGGGVEYARLNSFATSSAGLFSVRSGIPRHSAL